MTQEEYQNKLDNIERDNPGEVLLPLLRQGYSAVNVAYMRRAWARRRDDSEPVRRASVAEVSTTDPVLTDLYREKTRLFGLMNQQSNKFHQCKTDADRALNSKAVLSIWEDIQAVKARISFYLENGELPAEQEQPIPADPIQLVKFTQAVRVKISQRKNNIRSLASMDPSTPGRDSKIKAQQDALSKMQHLLGICILKMEGYGKNA